MQRSRRQFGGSHLEESSEADDDGSRTSAVDETIEGRDLDDRGPGRGAGIKSSWLGDRARDRSRKNNTTRTTNEHSSDERDRSPGSSRSRGKLVDIGLESTTEEDDPPDDLAVETSLEDPPSIQQFRIAPRGAPTTPFPLQEANHPHTRGRSPLSESRTSSPLPTTSFPSDEPPRHDTFWGTLYLICLAAFFASFILVFLHTSAPTRSSSLGDTVYTALHGSYYLLGTYTLIAVLVSLFWLALLRSYVRPLVYIILVAVPVVLFSFFLYPLISSFQGKYHGASIQDQAMRWFSFIPGALSVLWAYSVFKGRNSLSEAIRILEFSCRVLAANPGLVLVGFATLTAVIAWTWVWVVMFARVFLSGHLAATRPFFVIPTSTWWLGAFFILVYLWTVGILSGLQRATTAATVSQWYFHRLAVPAPTSQEVIRAAASHAFTTLFGTVSLSTLLALAIRLPVLLAPRRLTAIAGLCSYTVIPSTIATLTNPLTLTYAAIHSQPLSTSSRALARLNFLTPEAQQAQQFLARNQPTKAATQCYTLALLLLRSTRFITAIAMGFGAWVNTARSLTLPTTLESNPGNTTGTIRGSLYAYIVGLIAAAIGWGILGAIDGVVAGIVDAVVVCWGSEVARGEVRYCREAEGLFGGKNPDGPGSEEEGRGFLRGLN